MSLTWGMQLAIVVSTAVLSSLVTVGLAYLVVVWRLKPRLQRQVHQGLEELGEQLRRQVHQGVLDAVRSLPATSTEAVRGTGQAIARTAEELIKGGLSSVFAGGRGAKEDPDGRP